MSLIVNRFIKPTIALAPVSTMKASLPRTFFAAGRAMRVSTVATGAVRAEVPKGQQKQTKTSLAVKALIAGMGALSLAFAEEKVIRRQDAVITASCEKAHGIVLAKIMQSDKTATQEWRALFATPLSDDAVDGFITTLGATSAITQRFNQLQKIPTKQKPTPFENLYKALFIERVIAPIQNRESQYLSSQELGWEGRLQVDWIARKFYFIESVSKEGNDKRMSHAWEVSLDSLSQTQPELVAHFVAKRKVVEREEKIHKILRDVPNLYPPHSITKSVEKSSFSTFVAPFAKGGSLEDLLASGKAVPLSDQIAYAVSLLTTFSAMHKKNVIHGDIKPGNILLIQKGQKPLVIDFGLAVVAKVGKKIKPSERFQHNAYGENEFYQAPELVRWMEKERTGSEYKKTDDFALGKTLYQLYCNQRFYCRIGDVQEEINQKIKPPYFQPQHTSISLDRSAEEKYLFLLFKLTCPNPQDRWTMHQALDYTETIRNFE